MVGGGWAPIDGWGPEDDRQQQQGGHAAGATAAPLASGPAPVPVEEKSQRRLLIGGLAGIVVVLLVGVGLAVVGAESSGPDAGTDEVPSASGRLESDGDETDVESDVAGSATGDTSDTDDDDRDPEIRAQGVFTRAAERLRHEGSFAYSGQIEVQGPSALRPSTLPEGRLTVEGQVSFPRRSREVAVAADGRAYETVLVGPGVWERSAAGADGLAAAPLELTSRGVRAELSLALVPEWLDMAEDAVVVTDTPGGGRQLEGAVRYWDGPDDMTVVLDVDGHEVPTHVRLLSAETSLTIDLDITALGATVDIPTPGGGPVGVQPAVTAADLADLGIAGALQLSEVPPGWILVDASVQEDWPRAGCATLDLHYGPVDSPVDDDEWFHAEIRSAECAGASSPGEIRLTVGAYEGEIGPYPYHWSDYAAEGYVSDGTTTISFDTSFPDDEVRRVLASARPYDPEAQPTPTDTLRPRRAG